MKGQNTEGRRQETEDQEANSSGISNNEQGMSNVEVELSAFGPWCLRGYEARLKKQSQFAVGYNEVKLIYDKGLRAECRFRRPGKQSQFAGLWPGD